MIKETHFQPNGKPPSCWCRNSKLWWLHCLCRRRKLPALTSPRRSNNLMARKTPLKYEAFASPAFKTYLLGFVSSAIELAFVLKKYPHVDKRNSLSIKRKNQLSMSDSETSTASLSTSMSEASTYDGSRTKQHHNGEDMATRICCLCLTCFRNSVNRGRSSGMAPQAKPTLSFAEVNQLLGHSSYG